MPNNLPRVLIVSNNPLSTTENNGKTLASLFNAYDAQQIGQLYFQSDLPTVNIHSYFRITDSDTAKRVFLPRNSVGRIVHPVTSLSKVSSYNPTSRLKKSSFLRYIREMLWLPVLNNSELLRWSDSVRPQIVFFLAGDSLFAYKIVELLCSRYSIPRVVYVTDDYISKTKSISPFFWIRRHDIEQALRIAANKSILFLTISDKMRRVFKNLFDVDSCIFRNEMVSMTRQTGEALIRREDEPVVLVYAGGLHYNRWNVLAQLAHAIQASNNICQTKLHLNIYCTQKVNNRVVRALNIPSASSYLGSVTRSELEKIYVDCQVLVHVEAFDKRSRDAVALSFSTKITEYLALNRCILAVGPSEVASIEYLMDCAICITNPSSITTQAVGQLVDPMFRAKYASLAEEKVKHGEAHGITSKEFSERLRMIVQ